MENHLLAEAKAEGETELVLDVREEDDAVGLQCAERSSPEDDTEDIARFLRSMGIRRARLDVLLEAEQFRDVMTLLWGLRRALRKPDPLNASGVSPCSVDLVRQLLSDEGLHMFCCDIHLARDTGTLSIAYTYCETTFSKAVTVYKARSEFHRDHRAFFRAAPRFATVAAVMICLPWAIAFAYVAAGMQAVLWAAILLAIGAATWVGTYVLFQTIGSVEYDKEEQSRALDSAYRELSRAHAKIENDLEIARRIQHNLLPCADCNPFPSRLRIAAWFEPEMAVGGDYYDWRAVGDRQIGLVFSDVSGHGMSAAFITGLIKSRFAMGDDGLDSSARFVELTNAALVDLIPDGSFAALFFALYDVDTRTLRYTNAGHVPLPFLMTGGKGDPVQLGDSLNLIIGISEEAEYEEAETRLDPGSRLVFCTDGITEAFDPDGVQFGEDRLKALLKSSRESSADELCGLIREEVSAFTRGEPQHDDQTVVVLEVMG